MQVILLEANTRLGALGDKVEVKSGYARNFLIPQGKATPATKENIKYFEACRAKLEEKLIAVRAAAEMRALAINKLGSVTLASKAGVEGRLFGSIGTRDIANAITAAGIDVVKSEVRLPNGVLRTTGNHGVNIQVHSSIFAFINVVVVPQS